MTHAGTLSWSRLLGDLSKVELSLTTKNGEPPLKVWQDRVSLIEFSSKLTRVALDFCKEGVAESGFEINSRPLRDLNLVKRVFEERSNQGSSKTRRRGRKEKVYTLSSIKFKEDAPQKVRGGVYAFALNSQGQVLVNISKTLGGIPQREFSSVEDPHQFLATVRQLAVRTIVECGFLRGHEARELFKHPDTSNWKININKARNGGYGKHVEKLGLLYSALLNHNSLWAGDPESIRRINDIPDDDEPVTIAS